MTSKIVGKIKRQNGVAGQYAYVVTVQYPGEDPERMSFVGSVYGGPIIMVTRSRQTIVRDPERFGKFGPEWVRRFFA